MTAALLFACSFAVVFFLGIQQLNVEGRHGVAAFLTSFAIGGATLVQFKVLPGPTGVLDIGAYLLGSALGIVASMWAHPLVARAFRRTGKTSAAETIAQQRANELGESLQLATRIADASARCDIESFCTPERQGHHTWYDLRMHGDDALAAASVADAGRYLYLRGQLVLHPVQQHLVRFPTKRHTANP